MRKLPSLMIALSLALTAPLTGCSRDREGQGKEGTSAQKPSAGETTGRATEEERMGMPGETGQPSAGQPGQQPGQQPSAGQQPGQQPGQPSAGQQPGQPSAGQQPGQQPSTGQQPGQQPPGTGRDVATGERFAGSKDQAVAEAKTTLQSMESQITALEDRLEQRRGEMDSAARTKAESSIASLKKARDRASAQVDAMEKASADRWEQTRTQAASAFDDLDRAFEEAKTQLNP